jgi:hypothetical protein
MGGNLLKFIMLLWLGMGAIASHAIPVGFNQSWFRNDYGVQFLDSHFSKHEVTRIFDWSVEAGSKNLRLWFLESPDFPMLEWSHGQIKGLKPEYIRNVIETLRIARERNVRVYMTILDGQAYRPDLLSASALFRLKTIYSEKGGANFLEKVIAPLLRAIQDAGLSDAISRIDISNEMDSVVKRFGFPNEWSGAARMLCQWRGFIHELSGFAQHPVTFSLRLHRLVPLPANILDDQGPMACADYLDFHSYDDQGRIENCDGLKAFADQRKKDLILGEFGQSYFNHSYDDSLQSRVTGTYLRNASRCGFKEALAWRLSDIRPGYNKEARYSHESHGKMRPAFWLIQKHNLTADR